MLKPGNMVEESAEMAAYGWAFRYVSWLKNNMSFKQYLLRSRLYYRQILMSIKFIIKISSKMKLVKQHSGNEF